jgi:anti-anti-sigma regulatory factor
MPTEVRHLVESGQSYPVVRLIGVLEAGTTQHVRAALLDALARQPEALIIDVCDLAVPDRTAVSVLSDVARETTDWPDAHLVLCAPEGDKVWQQLGFPVWPSPAEALKALGPADPSHQLSLDLQPVIGAARRSRELVTEACTRWKLPELTGPASIVVTEMVNNVVAHARTPMTVLLALRDGNLTVAVRDRSTTVPRFHGPVEPTSYGGRGLLLIDSVARRWGNLVLDDGKVVWAILHSEDETMDAGLPSHAGAGDPA